MSYFSSKIYEITRSPLKALDIETLQINLGRYCNQRCLHCHVDAGPHKQSETMPLVIIDGVLNILKENHIHSIDITGGAPELHPHFEYLVKGAGELGGNIIVRSNLTSLILPGKKHLFDLFKAYKVEIVASLPCYLEENVDSQRGPGVYRKSMVALKLLNANGYGVEGSGLILNLVYNPAGASLPGTQDTLEADYKRELKRNLGVTFNKLFTLTNIPIGRFREDLMESESYSTYTALLRNSFNRETIPNLMCRKMLSIGWDGKIFDCDFNQALGLEIHNGAPRTLFDFDFHKLKNREIIVGEHCFGCTAGRGSSCGGQLARN